MAKLIMRGGPSNLVKMTVPGDPPQLMEIPTREGDISVYELESRTLGSSPIDYEVNAAIYNYAGPWARIVED